MVPFYPHDDNASDDLKIKLCLIRLDKSERSVFEEMRKTRSLMEKIKALLGTALGKEKYERLNGWKTRTSVN